MDGGRLILIHALGVVVEYGRQKYFYPLGQPLSAKMPLEQAELYPEVQYAARLLDGQRAGG